MWIGTIVLHCLVWSCFILVDGIRNGSSCDISHDVLLLNNPNGKADSYLRCTSLGFGTSGIWIQEICLYGTEFVFQKQHCERSLKKLNSQEVTHNITILNNSCAHGERCIGGTICDITTLKCLCPYGTTADYETLLCIPSQHQTHQQISSSVAAVNSFQENTISDSKSLQIMFRVRVPPGGSCANDEVCGGASVCTLPMKICLCPENLEDIDGYCQVPARKNSTDKENVDGSWIFHMYPPTQTTDIEKARPTKQGNTERESITQVPLRTITKEAMSPEAAKVSGTDKQSGVGVFCQANTDCMIGAYCKTSPSPATCQCLSTHVNINGLCEKVIYPGGDGCRFDAQCSIAFDGAICNGGLCSCPNGMLAVEQTCVPVKTNVRSLPDGGVCNVDDECGGGSVCYNNSCQCPQPTMIIVNGECVNAIMDKNDANQSTTPETLFNNMRIESSSNSENHYFKPPGDSCGPLDECYGGSSCIEGICLCPAQAMPLNGQCVKSTLHNNENVNEREHMSVAASTYATSAASTYTAVASGTHTTSTSTYRNTDVTSTQFSNTTPTVMSSSVPRSTVTETSKRKGSWTQDKTKSANRIGKGRPLITGPPLRQKGRRNNIRIYKVKPGEGTCPAGSSPLRDQNNYLIICNGIKPNCPPLSYCYVTSYADQEYNCCKT